MKFPPRAEILTIGTELTAGSVVNTNAAFLGRELSKLGFVVTGHSSCPDETGAIHRSLREALRRARIVCVSGGLGPTPDDITREALADFFGVPLRFSREQFRLISRLYRERKKKIPSLVKREAEFPANAKPVLNQFGIALGFRMEEKGKVVVVLPGVPGELIRLFEHDVKPFLKRRFEDLLPLKSFMAKTVGLSEPTIMQRLGRDFFKLGEFQFGIYPELGEAGLRISADSFSLIRKTEFHIRRVLRGDIYSTSEESLEAVIGKMLRRKRRTLSLAESCSGGRASEMITRIPGASRYFRGAVVSYHDSAKIRLLGVSPGLLERKGAVSRDAALALARGVRERFRTTLGLSITGIAGPRGGSEKKPVGLVFMALSSPTREKVWEEHFSGDRNQIQWRAAKKLLEHLWRWLR